jgi:hypothetical protein
MIGSLFFVFFFAVGCVSMGYLMGRVHGGWLAEDQREEERAAQQSMSRAPGGIYLDPHRPENKMSPR